MAAWIGEHMTSRSIADGIADKGIAIVTGASSGIGMVYADRLAKRGFDLILVARREDRLNAVAQRLRTDHGVSIETIVGDLENVADLERLVNALEADARIMMLVNNAGTANFTPFPKARTSDIDTAIDVNTKAVSRLCRAALPGFRERDHGVIINISSMLSFYFLSINSVYSGTKGYLINFTRGLQEEVAGSNVIVQLVIPAVVATEIWDKGGFPLSALDESTIMTAEDCVDAALAGLDQGERITFPSLEDDRLWSDYDAARVKLLGATQTNKPASRYRLAE